MPRKKGETVWVVVLVHSGIPVLAEAYRNMETAKAREGLLRKTINPDYDETSIFEIEIGVESPDAVYLGRGAAG